MRRRTESPKMFQEMNSGEVEVFSNSDKLYYTPKKNNIFEYFTITKTEDKLFILKLFGLDTDRGLLILNIYYEEGGPTRDMFNKHFEKRSANEIGLILLTLDWFHNFDKNSKTELLKFIGLSNFPMPTPIAKNSFS